jgi:acyl dehydratase
MRTVWDDFKIGSSCLGPMRQISADDILIHAKETGDFYPHHMDAEWCATQPFRKRMAHGTLVFSIAVGSIAEYINEAAMSYGYDKVRFIAPVFIDDSIQAYAEISGKREHLKKPENYGFIDESVIVTNQKGDTVMAFTHIYLVDKK